MTTSTQITWKDLYFDLYREVYGENATSAEVMKDVARRRRILRSNRARLAEQEQTAIDSARAQSFTLDAFLVSVGQRPRFPTPEQDRIQRAIYATYTEAELADQARMEAAEFYGHSGRRAEDY